MELPHPGSSQTCTSSKEVMATRMYQAIPNLRRTILIGFFCPGTTAKCELMDGLQVNKEKVGQHRDTKKEFWSLVAVLKTFAMYCEQDKIEEKV